MQRPAAGPQGGLGWPCDGDLKSGPYSSTFSCLSSVTCPGCMPKCALASSSSCVRACVSPLVMMASGSCAAPPALACSARMDSQYTCMRTPRGGLPLDRRTFASAGSQQGRLHAAHARQGSRISAVSAAVQALGKAARHGNLQEAGAAREVGRQRELDAAVAQALAQAARHQHKRRMPAFLHACTRAPEKPPSHVWLQGIAPSPTHTRRNKAIIIMESLS